MVGVPGKSKGCSTCKKRRIKCDEVKPTCNRCAKSGYICEGYQTALQFVNTSTAPFQPHISSTTAIPRNQAIPIKVIPRIRSTNNTDPETTPLPHVPASTVPKELSLIAFQSEICKSYLLHNSVWRTYGVGWLEVAAANKLDLASSEAVGALSTIYFGIEKRLEDVKLQGAKKHGKVLRLVRPKLASLEGERMEECLVPILLMLMHAMYGEDEAASAAHIMGLGMFLQMAGPARFQKGALRKAFESARASLTIAHLISRQPLFLAQKNWKTIPWALDPSSKNHQNLLTDILIDIPGLLSDFNLYDGRSISTRDQLLEQVTSHLYTLYLWRYNWELCYPDAAYITPPTIHISSQSLVSTHLNFRSHSHAAELNLYNGTLIFLLSLIHRLSFSPSTLIQTVAARAALATNFPPLVTFSSGPLLLPEMISGMIEPATEIVRIFEWQMECAEGNMESDLFGLWPVGVAWEVLEGEGRWRERIERVMERRGVMRVRTGVGREFWGRYEEEGV